MSIRTVSREVRTALQDQSVSGAEAKAIVAEAEKGRVTTGESKQLVDVWNQANAWSINGPPGHLSPPRVHMDNEARGTFNAYFAAHNVPSGKNFDGVKDQIKATLSATSRGPALACEPNTKHLHAVFLGDSRPVDGERLDAWLNTEKKEFYLQSTGAGMAGPDTVGPHWYGPFPLADKPAVVTASSLKAQLEGDFAKTQELGRHVFGNNVSRSDSLTIEGVTERPDGLFDVQVGKRHFLNRDLKDDGRVVVDEQGTLRGDFPPMLTPENMAKVKAAFTAAKGSLSFSRDGLPMGPRFNREHLERQPGFDTYTYTALIGTGAVQPGARASDPNKATSFFVERSGGFAGMTEYAGPISLAASDPTQG